MEEMPQPISIDKLWQYKHFILLGRNTITKIQVNLLLRLVFKCGFELFAVLTVMNNK
jgi:hypothetical protein